MSSVNQADLNSDTASSYEFVFSCSNNCKGWNEHKSLNSSISHISSFQEIIGPPNQNAQNDVSNCKSPKASGEIQIYHSTPKHFCQFKSFTEINESHIWNHFNQFAEEVTGINTNESNDLEHNETENTHTARHGGKSILGKSTIYSKYIFRQSTGFNNTSRNTSFSDGNLILNDSSKNNTLDDHYLQKFSCSISQKSSNTNKLTECSLWKHFNHFTEDMLNKTKFQQSCGSLASNSESINKYSVENKAVEHRGLNFFLQEELLNMSLNGISIADTPSTIDTQANGDIYSNSVAKVYYNDTKEQSNNVNTNLELFVGAAEELSYHIKSADLDGLLQQSHCSSNDMEETQFEVPEYLVAQECFKNKQKSSQDIVFNNAHNHKRNENMVQDCEDDLGYLDLRRSSCNVDYNDTKEQFNNVNTNLELFVSAPEELSYHIKSADLDGLWQQSHCSSNDMDETQFEVPEYLATQECFKNKQNFSQDIVFNNAHNHNRNENMVQDCEDDLGYLDLRRSSCNETLLADIQFREENETRFQVLSCLIEPQASKSNEMFSEEIGCNKESIHNSPINEILVNTDSSENASLHSSFANATVHQESVNSLGSLNRSDSPHLLRNMQSSISNIDVSKSVKTIDYRKFSLDGEIHFDPDEEDTTGSNLFHPVENLSNLNHSRTTNKTSVCSSSMWFTKTELRLAMDEICADHSLVYSGPNISYVSLSSEKRQSIQNKITDVWFWFIRRIRNSEPLVFLDKFCNWKNAYFENDMLLLRQDKSTKIKYSSVRSRRKFILILYLIIKCYMLLKRRSYATYREIYYTIKRYSYTCTQVEHAMIAISYILRVEPWYLPINSTSKGLVFGKLLLVTSDADITRCDSFGGTLIPQNIANISQIISKADFILVVEKDAIFKQLLDDGIADKLIRPFIMITGKGYPDLNTRLFLKKLWVTLKIPVFILVDADPDGINIMLTYRFGSLHMAHLSEHLAIPKMKWLGIHPRDIVDMNINSQSLTQREVKLIENMLKRPYIAENPWLRSELEILRRNGRKAEIEDIMKTKPFLVQVYLPNKFGKRYYY